MGYYMRGDYYRGDPFIGGLISAAGKALGVNKLVDKAGSWVKKQVLGSKGGSTATGVSLTGSISPILQHGVLPLAGGAVAGTAIGATTRLLGFGQNGEKKRRRMNPLNPKALKRSLRRTEAFEQIAKRTVNALYKTSSCGCSKRTRKFKRS